MKKLSNEQKQPLMIIKLLILAILNAIIFLYFLPIAAAGFATGIPEFVICIIFGIFSFLIVSQTKRISEWVILCLAAFLLTLLFLRLFGHFAVTERYIAIVNDPDPDERHLHLTDRLGLTVNMLGFLFVSGFAAAIRFCIILENSENENPKEQRQNEMTYQDCEIRPIKPDEIGILDDFLYEAIYQPDINNLAPKNIIEKPELQVYIKDFGKPDDNCLVAVCDGEIVGAVWTRIIDGFGSVDEKTPEFAIALFREYRGRGIGTNLMREMLELLRAKGYKQTSLAVQKENYAVKMYKAVGFEIAKELSEEYLMIYKF
jgi:ribosomal protein S18 acetylase RimI-like enzyme